MNNVKNTAQALDNLSNIMKLFGEQMGSVVKDIKKNDTEIEVMKPYFSTIGFRTPTVYRFNQKNMRYYFTVNNENEEVIFFPSVTTIIDKTMPLSYGLKVLIGDLGLKEFSIMMNKKAKYGTLLHILIADYFRSGKSQKERTFDFDSISGRISLYVEEENIDFEVTDWEWEISKDLLSLIKFSIDYNVEPIAIEAVGTFSDGLYRYAGAIDLICEMDYTEEGYFGETYKSGEKKGEPKVSKRTIRILSIVDFKSGKSGFFESHEIQINMYKDMAIQSFGLKITYCFNVAPKNWASTPTYTIKDQTESPSRAKIPYLLGAFNCEWEEPKDLLIISGKLNGGGLAEVCKWVPAKDYVLRKLGLLNNNISEKIVPQKEFELELN